MTRVRALVRGAAVRFAAAALAVSALTCGVAVMVRLPAASEWARRFPALGAYGALFAMFLLGAWLVAGLAPRRAALVTLLGSVALQVAAATTAPRYSDDLYRYV